MTEIDLSTVSADALAEELAARQTAERAAIAAAELEALAPYIALGFGDQAADELVDALRALRPGATGTVWETFVRAALAGMEGLQATVGARIKLLRQSPPGEGGMA